jgi:hypothetical protein
MKYVNMNEVAFDPDSIVFPGLGNCHGIVYVNENGLFAFHNYGDPLKSKGKIGAFGMFVRNHPNGQAKGLCLYGACPSNRHSKDKSHKEELKWVAEAIQFSGPIHGCRWDIAKLGWGTTYTEFRCNRTKVTIWIENFTGCDDNNQESANTDNISHKFVKQALAHPQTGETAWSQLTAVDEVITGVTRAHQATGQQVTAWKL